MELTAPLPVRAAANSASTVLGWCCTPSRRHPDSGRSFLAPPGGQVETGTAVSKENIQPGDAVYSNGTAHVAIWLGDGQVLEAQTFGVPIGVHPFDLNNAENIRRFG